MNKDGTCYEREWLGPDGEITNPALFLAYMDDMLKTVEPKKNTIYSGSNINTTQGETKC